MASKIDDEEQLILNAKLFISVIEKSGIIDKTVNILKCLDEGADVNSRFKNNKNNTCLHIAASKGEKEIVEFLLDKGANNSIKNDNKKTALDLAKQLNTDDGKDIVATLEAHNIIKSESKASAVLDKAATSTNVFREKPKRKRDGTSGIEGQLYETKLLSLLLLRLYDKKVTEFCLGSSLKNIGALDDICIRYKYDGVDRIIFLQAKHKKNIEARKITIEDLWKENDDFSLLKYFASYLEIRKVFDEKNVNDTTNSMFQGKYEDLQCDFILYTPANEDLKEKKRLERNIPEKIFNSHKTVKDLIYTGENGNVFQYKYDKTKDIELLSKIVLVNKVKQMGLKLLKLIYDNSQDKDNKRYNNIMTDSEIKYFHIILAQKVIYVSDVKEEGYRIGTFREEFFSSNDEIMIILRETLYTEVVKKNKLSNTDIAKFLQSILLDPSASTISKLIGNVIMYNAKINRLEIIMSKIKEDAYFQKYLSQLQQLQVLENDAKEALEIAGKRELSFEFKLPSYFGNRDFKLPENKIKAGNVLKNQVNKITKLIHEATDKNITIYQNVPWIENAVGNLLIMDDNSNSFRFNVQTESLENNAKSIMQQLNESIKDLGSYRFTIKIFKFPKTTFDIDDYEKSFAVEFLNNLWFYTCQAKENQIDGIAETVIKNCNVDKKFQSVCRVNAKAAFALFHNEIQNWWKDEEKSNDYLTNYDLNIFEDVLNDLVHYPWINVLSSIYTNKIKNYDIEFNTEAIESLELDKAICGLKIIKTEAIILSGSKLVQYFENNKNYSFIDLDFVLSLDSNSFHTTFDDIINTNVDVLVILYENTSRTKNLDILERLLHGSNKKQVILVTNNNLNSEVKKRLQKIKYVEVNDEKNNLIDLTPLCQEKLLEMYFIFQGESVRFNAVIDSELKHLIKTGILLKMINGEQIRIGNKLTNSEYDENKEYYVPRCLSQRTTAQSKMQSVGVNKEFSTDVSGLPTNVESSASNSAVISSDKKIYKIQTLDELDAKVPIIVGPYKVGKSILLTHLSIETKKVNPVVWIETIVFQNHVQQFAKWKNEKIDIDAKESLRFICKAALSKYVTNNEGIVEIFNHDVKFDIDIIDGEIVLKNSDKNNDLISLELELFIHSYNKGNVTLIFDDFDRVYAYFRDQCMSMLKCLTTNARNARQIWIVCRSYGAMKMLLENEFGTSYSLEQLSITDQKIYFTNFFKANLKLSELNYDQFKNINGLFEYVAMLEPDDVTLANAPLYNIYLAAIEYFLSEIKRTPLSPDTIEFRGKWKMHNLSPINLAGESIGSLSEYLKYFHHKIVDKMIPLSPPDEFKWDLELCRRHYQTLLGEFQSVVTYRNLNNY